MITFRHKGNFSKTNRFLKQAMRRPYLHLLDKYGQRGVDALAAVTPKDSGNTAGSWVYDIAYDKSGISIVWSNTNVNKGVNIAVILQYGHGTRNGGYVEGIDYINPALKPIFDELANEAWKEVASS